MKILIVATSHKPNNFFEELRAVERYRIEYHPSIIKNVMDGKTGILVQGNDSDDMAQAIEALWEDPVRASEMGNTAKQWVRETFSLENWLNQFGSLIHNSS